MRNFENWLNTFVDNIVGYKYYVDFDKVYANVNKIKIQLNILNSLIGSNHIKEDFENIIQDYPEVLKCVPILLAVRESKICVLDDGNQYIYKFNEMNYSIAEYECFMEKTGLFDLISNHLVNNLVDYVFGVEAGLNSNGRKNRGGHRMEDIVEEFIKQTGNEYYKEMYLKDIENKWNIDLSNLSNKNKTKKRFDFVVKTKTHIYVIETNFYNGGGSKLNETARSYKMLAKESINIPSFSFVWITDGPGWVSARHNLEETFDVLESLYNINDLKKGILNNLFQ